MQNNQPYNIAIFGEILWDVLPTGAKPGGAPMNMAYHLHKLGQRPAFISRIGKDDYGSGLIDFLQGHGLETGFIQEDAHQPTGIVPATPNEHGEMQYEIVQPVAWDFIGLEESAINTVQQANYFVFGSLAARSAASGKTLFTLLENAQRKVLDINLRPPHYSKPILTELLNKADIVKMNLTELELISHWFGDYDSVEDMLQLVQEKFMTGTLVVTLGGDGAVLLRNGQLYRHEGFRVTVADTVGAGDSFLAALLHQFLQKSHPADALEFASALGALVASRPGGCPDYQLQEIQDIISFQKQLV